MSDIEKNENESRFGASQFFRLEDVTTAALLVGSAVCFAYFLSFDWDNAWFYVWVPLWAIGLAVSRSTVFSVLLPITVLASIAGIKLTGSTFMDSPQRTFLAVSGIATIVFSTRFGVLCAPAAQMLASQRINYTPTKTSKAASTKPDENAIPKRFDFGWLFTLGFFVIAWFVGGYFASQLASVLRNYPRARLMLDKSIGLLPEWYVGLIVLFALAAALWLAQQLLSYLVLRRGSVAAMHLRSELWKWDGTEQRRIGKELSQMK